MSVPTTTTASAGPEAKAPEAEHPYNSATIDALGFLYAVMRDQHTSLRWRVDAAEKLMHIDPHGYIARQDHEQVTIRIGGIKYDA